MYLKLRNSMGIEASVKELLLNQIKVISENNPNKDGKPEPLYTSFVRWACENILNIKDDFDVEEEKKQAEIEGDIDEMVRNLSEPKTPMGTPMKWGKSWG